MNVTKRLAMSLRYAAFCLSYRNHMIYVKQTCIKNPQTERMFSYLAHRYQALWYIIHDLFADGMCLIKMLDDQFGLEDQTFEQQ